MIRIFRFIRLNAFVVHAMRKGNGRFASHKLSKDKGYI